MSFLRLLPKISVPRIEPGGLDESFLAEQCVDRPKHALKRCSVILQSMNNRMWLRFSLPVEPFLCKSWAMPIRHSLHLAAESREAGGSAGCWRINHRYRPWTR